jgi:cytochrome c oxidase cbb3-type subunit I
MSDFRLPSNPTVPVPSQGEIDASCRLPLLTLFSGAALWLVLAAVGAMLASMSFHRPDMFADKMWLGYGRILPAARTWLVYGFCLPAGYGIALWIAARLGRTLLASPVAVMVGAKLWHIGVFIGSFGILCGASTGHEGFEMPRYAMVMLFLAASLIGFIGLLTIHQRTERELYPSQWFIITALLWLPWILSTAIVLLDLSPVRGVAQTSVLVWYVNNLQFVTLGLFGMAAGLYFIPKLARKGLHSKHLALFSLLTLVLFGSWSGLTIGGPLPAWMGAIGSVAAVFSIVPVIAHMDNVRRTCCFNAPEPEARFFSLAVPMLVLATVLAAVGAFVAQTHFTLFQPGQRILLLQGFFGLVALGGIYHILPKVADIKWPFAGLIRAHFWCALLAVLLVALPFLFGGWRQGAQAAHVSGSFVDVARGTLMPIRIASMGELLWLLGSLCLALNVFVLVFRWAHGVVRPLVAEITRPVAASEVKG